MKSAIKVLKEQIESFYLVRRLSLYELKSQNNNNYLGLFWEILNPGIQIAIYWFVFGFIIRGGREAANGVPFFPWLLSGIILWFFIQPSIVQGSKSIYSRIRMISKMSFPLSVIPTYVIFSKLYPHIFLLGFTIVVLQFMGFPVSIYYLQLPYFLFATVALLVSISLVTSTLATIVRDVQMVVQSLMRMLLYLTPILWVSMSLPGPIKTIMKLNPLYYLVEGYRAALLGQEWYIITEYQLTIYFWAVVIFLYILGSSIHVKFRRHFVDFL
ncbi:MULTISPECIES: ABC transporter permease [Cytobacillus]|uniref:Transport permease protein n=1 Tax=Cytobacillus firmus TaxID=1399 RepID=A0AA46PNW1_CYTFI|nr:MULTISPECIES: ABC transporter permease [Cytobacillus]KML41327.1 teichoic acid ABC transporter permease [Cytobacillus firmus]MCM3092560.1 ABC transporter permease [Cytobacillus sp. AMY 15.2]UYG93852.1 ABC transporter permease [Cytobacillus firmus]